MSQVLYNAEGGFAPPNAWMIDRMRAYMSEKLYAVEVKLVWTAFREPEHVTVRCIVDAANVLEAGDLAREAALARCGGEQPDASTTVALVKSGEGWPFQ